MLFGTICSPAIYHNSWEGVYYPQSSVELVLFSYDKYPTEQDSKELSPRSLDKMLLELQVNSRNVQSTQLTKFFKFSKSSKFLKCSKFKPCQIIILEYSYNQNDTILSILLTQKFFGNCKRTRHKIWANGRKKVSDADDKVIPMIALSMSSDQKKPKLNVSRDAYC